MPRYLFSLGAVPELSEAELRSLCTVYDIAVLQLVQKNGSIILETQHDIPLLELFSRLGGSVYVAEMVQPLGKDVGQTIAAYLATQHPEGKIRFGLSGVRDTVGVQVKKILKQEGYSVRYVAIGSMATIVHNNLVERQAHLTVHDGYLYVTKAVHDFAAMAAFDEYRPAIDSKSGMLPPKLARMMINIAGAREHTVLLDPFCGSGTVLLEAAAIGLTQLLGSDISEKAVIDTKTNMEWYLTQQTQRLSYTVVLSDVRTLASVFSPGSVDVIVCEPFMGKPKKGNETEQTIDREVRDLAALYADTLASFAELLKPGGTVVFSKPRFAFRGGWKTIPWEQALQAHHFSVVPLLPQKDMVLYAREGQLVGREIWKMQKQ